VSPGGAGATGWGIHRGDPPLGGHGLARYGDEVMSRRLLLVCALGLAACGEDAPSPEDAPFEPLCGQDGPVELLALAADEEVATAHRLVDDHVVVRVSVEGEVRSDDPAHRRRNVVLDACGGVISEVASDAEFLKRWDDVLVGCIGEDLVSLAGYDDPSPTLLLPRACGRTQRVGERWVVVDAEPNATLGRVVSLEVVGTEIRTHELVAGVLHDGIDGTESFASVVDGEVFVQTPDLAVHRVDPVTGALALELAAAEAGTRFWDVRGPWIAYQPPAAGPDEPVPLVLRDRRTGAEQIVLDDVREQSFGWVGDGLLRVSRVVDLATEQRLFGIEPVREIAIPRGTLLSWQRDDGRSWLQEHDRDQRELRLWLWHEGAEPQLEWSCTECDWILSARTDGYFEYLIELSDPERNEMWRFEDAGGPPRMVGNAPHVSHVMDDDRVLTVLMDEDDRYGELVLLDEEGVPVETIETDANRFSAHFTIGYDVPGEIVYEARHPDGTSSLYRARLAP